MHSKERVFSADIILKIAALKEDELKFLRPDQVLISPLHIPKLSAKFLDTLKQKRVIALAMDYIKDRNGFFPIVRMMSEMAGIFGNPNCLNTFSHCSNNHFGSNNSE